METGQLTARWRYFLIAGVILWGIYLLFFSNLNTPYNFSTHFAGRSLSFLYPESKDANSEVVQVQKVWTGDVTENPINSANPDAEIEIPVLPESIIEISGNPTPINNSSAITDSSFDSGSEKSIETVIQVQANQDIVTEPGGKSTFSKILEEFEWNSYQEAITSKNATVIKFYLEKLVLRLSEFLALEPNVSPNPKCVPPPLQAPEQINCSAFPTGLTGVRKNQTSKIGILVQFGFDVDVLEIHLNELYDIVDRFFIIESTKAHQRTLIKPLIWEKVQFQPRFMKFADKITHLIIDDAQSAEVAVKVDKNPTSDKTTWLMENLQESLRWDKFLEWNNAKNIFTDDDILGFGDADEIPSRKMVNMLKYCELKGGMVDFGIWFPFGNIKYAFATDHPIRGYKYTIGEPGYWTLKKAMEVSTRPLRPEIPSRTHGRASNFLLGGMHMTHYGYLPFQLVKQITATEGSPYGVKEIQKISTKLTVEELQKLELDLASVPKQFRYRMKNLTEISNVMKDIAIFPWYYDCNRDRYPIWEGKHDSRIYMRIKEE